MISEWYRFSFRRSVTLAQKIIVDVIDVGSIPNRHGSSGHIQSSASQFNTTYLSSSHEKK
jgi:hypothetical protein